MLPLSSFLSYLCHIITVLEDKHQGIPLEQLDLVIFCFKHAGAFTCHQEITCKMPKKKQETPLSGDPCVRA